MKNCDKCNGCNKDKGSIPRLVQEKIHFKDKLKKLNKNNKKKKKEKLIQMRGIEDIELNQEEKQLVVCFDDIIINMNQIKKRINEIN